MMKFVLSLSVIFMSFSALAADSEGAFNTKGAAKRSCEAFTSTYADQGAK